MAAIAKATPLLLLTMFCMSVAFPPACAWQTNCPPPSKHRPHPPKHHRPSPSHPLPPRKPPPKVLPPIVNPPVISPPIITPPPVINPPVILPPIINPPVIIKPPPSPSTPCPPGGGGGGAPGIHPPATCPINALKLGLCLDVLGGLVHVGIGNPIENICCPVIQGLLELEAAVCLCTTIRLKLLNLNIFLPIALQVLATCGLTPPPGFVCPPLT
ncbi:36.4 kDa proline-rich protein-like [Andrographis paniculata]|uniref:36.4 kDa proline-rich protein-like n=1 Tax=Andrographis paniculata TaxID=175694 RepID=UPI0021E7471D|nr:36.4 kDa proline-rich protein-like [Andrographis paniculata]